MKKILTLSLVILAAIPTNVFAHEGHGFTTGNSPLHYMVEPFHVIVTLVAVSAIAGLVYKMRRQNKKS